MIEDWNEFHFIETIFFHNEISSQNRTFVRKLVDFILNFKMSQGLIGRLAFEGKFTFKNLEV